MLTTNTTSTSHNPYWAATNLSMRIYFLIVGLVLNSWSLLILRYTKLRAHPIFTTYTMLGLANIAYLMLNVQEAFVEPWLPNSNHYYTSLDTTLSQLTYCVLQNTANSTIQVLILLLGLVTLIGVEAGKHLQYLIQPRRIRNYTLLIILFALKTHILQYFWLISIEKHSNLFEITSRVDGCHEYCYGVGSQGWFVVGNLCMIMVLWKHRLAYRRVHLVILLQSVYFSMDLLPLTISLAPMNVIDPELKLLLTTTFHDMLQTIKLLRAGVLHILLFWFSQQYANHARYHLQTVCCPPKRRHRMMLHVRGGPQEEMSSEIATVMEDGYSLPVQN